MIRRYSFSYLFILLSAFFINSCDSDLSVIPRPQQIQSHIGAFRLPNRLSFVSYPQSVQNSELFSFLSEELEMRGVTVFSGGTEAAGKKIELRLDKSIEEEKPGRYYLTIRRKKIVISANEKAGLVYGIQTLLQLIDSRNGNLPRVTIRDYPHYRWRGLMLDCSRHFMEPEYIKRCIDIMAYYKMNRFHWHLTDDQGWRIDIK